MNCVHSVLLQKKAALVECTQTFSGHQDAVVSAVFSADGSSVLAAAHDCTAKVWSIDTGMCRPTFFGHRNVVCSAVFWAY